MFTRDLMWSRPWMGYDAMAGSLAVGCSGFIGVQTLVSDDFEIIRRVLQGEIDRFAELITRYQQHVAKITSRHVPSDRVAEVAHDVFVRAYSSLSGFSGKTPFEHWLSGIAIRTCYDFWRARKREELPVSALAETSRTPPKLVSPRSSRAASFGAPRNPPIWSRARPGTMVCSGTIESGIGMRSDPAGSCALAGV
jgi:hypothetical protein